MAGSLTDDIGKIVDALQRVYKQAGDQQTADLLAACEPRLEVSEHDNWNGGTYRYTLSVSVPPRPYAAYPDQASLDQLEVDLLRRIGRFTRLFISHVSAIKADAASLFDELRAYGISSFVAHQDIEPTKEWEDEIRLRASVSASGMVPRRSPRSFPRS